MYKAITDRIIVKLDITTENKADFYIRPKYDNCGVVINIGDKVRGIKVGDKIIFHQFDELPLPEKGLAIVREKSVLGVVAQSF